MPGLSGDQFRQPPAEYRPLAMWFLNGHLESDEVCRQVAAMAAGGVGSVQVAARTGLETPYLSERWLALVDSIIVDSARHGMQVWLADEYPYPSGASGGEVVLRHPEYRAWQMHAQRVGVHAGAEVRLEHPGSVPLRTCAVPIAGGKARWKDAVDLEAYVGLRQREQVLFQPSQVYLTTRRYLSSGPRPTLAWRVPDTFEEWAVWLIAASEIEDFKFFGAYVDLCSPQATALFLATTYERYFQRLGPARFAQLAGFFVDESHPQNWSWQLPDYFRERNGYDLIECLPALWTDSGPRTSRVRYDYWQTLTELFLHSFHRPVAAWCQRHGVQLSLEVPSTRNVVQRYADVPGIDPGHDKVGVPLDGILARELPSYRGNLSFPGSLAAQTGRQRVLDELFHSVGWSLTLQDMKAMLDRAAARGANLFAFHAFCYTVGGLRKWDAPPSQFDQNPYWPYFALLSAYAGRLAYALSRGQRFAPVALVDPVASVWTHQDAGGGRDATGRRIVESWTALMRELVAAQRPHDTLDPLLLAEASVEGGLLRLGEAGYAVIVLPPVTSLESAAWQKLEEFAASGGTVVACGLLPTEDSEPGSDVANRCASAFGEGRRGFVHLPEDAAALVRFLDDTLPAHVRVTPAAGEAARREFLLAQRRDGDRDLYFLANASMQEHDCDVMVRVRQPGGATLTRWDLETGDSQVLASTVDATELQVRLQFGRHGSHLLSVAPREGSHAEAGPVRPEAVPLAVGQSVQRVRAVELDVDLEGDWTCEPANDNALRLDRFAFTTTPEVAGAEHRARPLLARPDAPRVEPKPLINVFQDLTGAGQPWPGGLEAPPIFGAPPRVRLALPALAWYAVSFDVEHVPARAALCVETDALSGDWSMWLNGESLRPDVFQARRRWDVGNQEAEVTALLRRGINQLLVRVRAAESWDGLLDAVYLLGDFGVRLETDARPTVTRRPSSIRWAERHSLGFPYYAGTLHLSRQVSVPPTTERYRLRLPDDELMFAGVAELAVNGHALGVRAWAPYAWDLPAAAVRPGPDNELKLSITNTLVELLEGRRYDPATRGLVPVDEHRTRAGASW
jgi:hypothetical protein